VWYYVAMDSNVDRARTDAFAFLTKHKTGVLATVSAQGESRSRLIYYVCDDNFTIYFSTLSSTRKFLDFAVHPQASFTVATEDVPQTLQIEGVVSEVTEEQRIERWLAPLVDVLMSNKLFYWPVLKLSQGEVKLMQLKPTWIRWADYAFAEAGTSIYKEILVKE